MEGTMKALVFHEPRKLTVEKVPIPEVGPRDVLIRVKVCGICGSDLHSYKLGHFQKPGNIMGHELMGVVAEAGREVAGVKEGDRVFGLSFSICGKCYWCQREEYSHCPYTYDTLTGFGKPGAFAEYVHISNAVLNVNLYKIPDEIDDETAATIEPTSCSAAFVEQAGVKPGDKVMVLGAGMLGNTCMQAAKAAGAALVAVSEVSPLRLEIARQTGADAIFDARKGDAVEWAKELFGVGPYPFGEGAMADVVFEVAGVPLTVRQSFDMIRSGGTIAFVAAGEEDAPIDINKLMHKSPRIVAGNYGNFAKGIELLATGKVKTSSLITHRFSLDEGPEAFEMQLRSNEAIKVLIKP